MILGYHDELRTYAQPNAADCGPYAYYGNADALRLTCHWADLEPTPGVYNFSAINPALASMAAWGHKKVLPVILGRPPWQAGVPPGGDNNGFATQYDGNFYALVYWLLVRLIYQAPAVTPVGIEIWNEPNTSAFGSIQPARLAQITQLARAAANAQGLSLLPVMGGSVLCTDTFLTWPNYLAQFRAATGSDISLSIHPYDHSTNPTAANLAVKGKYDTAVVQAAGRPLWITEFGFSSTRSGWNQGSQAYHVADCYGYFRDHGAKAGFVYRLFEGPGGGPLFPDFNALIGSPPPSMPYPLFVRTPKTVYWTMSVVPH